MDERSSLGLGVPAHGVDNGLAPSGLPNRLLVNRVVKSESADGQAAESSHALTALIPLHSFYNSSAASHKAKLIALLLAVDPVADDANGPAQAQRHRQISNVVLQRLDNDAAAPGSE